VTNSRRRIGTVFSADDGHVVARNMWRKAINILRKFVHQVDSIFKRLYKDEGSTKHKSLQYNYIIYNFYHLMLYLYCPLPSQ